MGDWTTASRSTLTSDMAEGMILKALSGFYYVDDGTQLFACRGRGKFRHEKVTPLVGDRVLFTPLEHGSGTLDGILPRKNEFQRPAVANVDQLVIIVSQAVPATDPFLIDRVISIAERRGCDSVICVNKWDLVENKDQKVITTFETAIRNRMAPFVDFPIIFASALTKQRIFKVLETAKQVYQNRKAHIGTSKLNEVMLPIIEAYPPQSVKGKYIKIKYCTQLPNTTIPSFVFYANLPQYVKENYRRFLENKIRENWSLHGCPINIFIRQK